MERVPLLRVVDSFKGTDTGRQRRANEDAAFERSPLFAVADGMGGARAGEVASRIAVDVLEPGLPDGPASAEERLASLVEDANTRIHDLSQSDAERAGMGTTITVVHVGEDELAIAHVGDSRLYCLRDGTLERLTRDNSLVDELVREGKITQEEAEVHPQRSIITRALGPEPQVEVDRHTWRPRAGDVYLLCSDGLTTMVPEPEVTRILTEEGDRPGSRLADAGRALIDAANEAGGRDNITVVLFRIGDAEGVPADDDQATRLGADMPSVAEVEAGLVAQQAAGAEAAATATAAAAPSPVERRMPRLRRAVVGDEAKPRGRVRKTLRILGATLIVIFPFAAGGYIATQAVYFVGVSDDGFVTVYKGVPYELPLGIDMYAENFRSGVPVGTLPAPVAETVTEHKLRSLEDANDLVRAIERGEIAGQDGR